MQIFAFIWIPPDKVYLFFIPAAFVYGRYLNYVVHEMMI